MKKTTALHPALQLWKGWLMVEQGASAATLQSYLADGVQLQEWLAEQETTFEKCERTDLEQFLMELGREGAEASSIARKLSALRSLFGRMVAEKIRSDDPTTLLQSPKTGRYLPDALSAEAVFRILDGIDLQRKGGLRDRALIELLYGAGLRISEAIGLRLEQLRFDDGWILVQGKGSKQRLAPIGPRAADMIDHYRRHERPLLEPRSDHLILNLRGTALSRVGAWQIVKKWSAHEEGAISPHTFRHSYATHLLEGGIDLRVLQELLGHADIATTQIYTHLDRSHLRRAHHLYHPREQKR